MRAPHDQHFLVDTEAVEKISGYADVSGRNVLEIGPGKGILTEALLRKGARVIAVELDGKLVPYLEKRFSEEVKSGNLTIVHGDAIRCEIPDFDLVVANLPYSASSKITFRLIGMGFEEAVLMYQKEFAMKMMALPGTSECGRLSVMVQTYARVMPLLELLPSSFSPKPKVKSYVVRLTLKDELTYPINNRELYAIIVRELFSHRRKTIRKAVNISKNNIGIDESERILSCASEDILKKRPQELTLKEFAELSNTASG